MRCKHQGRLLRTEACATCEGAVALKVYSCDQFGECTIAGKALHGRPVCASCPQRIAVDAPAHEPPPPVELPALAAGAIPEWTFITSAMLAQHSLELVQYVPADCRGIAGVARSGLASATLLAATLNLPLWELSGQHGLRPIGSGSRTSGLTRQSGPLFVIDDSAYSGAAARNARKALLRENAILAAVYCRPEAASAVDCYARLLPSPHLFEWNLFNNGIVHGNASDPRLRGGIGFDFDGVLCEECPVDDQNHGKYSEWLQNARPRSIARLTDLPLIATARITRYESETRDWLRRWNIRPRRLDLFPAKENRRTPEQVAQHKAAAAQASRVSIFVESSGWQARRIHKLTGLPVICTDEGVVHR